jgi:hypothetical protein
MPSESLGEIRLILCFRTFARMRFLAVGALGAIHFLWFVKLFFGQKQGIQVQ